MTAPGSLADRVGQRLRQPHDRRRPSRIVVMLAALGTAVLLGFAAWVLLVSSVFGVAHVQVQGIARVGETEVVDAANIAAGTPLARLDTAAVAARVARIPAVGRVDVLRDWPRGVTIVVHERVPAAVRERGSGFVLVDRTGVVFDQVAKRPKGLPLVSAPVSAGAPALRAALDVLDALPPSIRGQVRSVRAASPDEVTLQLTHRRTVIWGDTGRGARKGAVLAVLLTRKAASYDVSVPDAPTTRK
jgi:cell division protein FtsQ